LRGRAFVSARPSGSKCYDGCAPGKNEAEVHVMNMDPQTPPRFHRPKPGRSKSASTGEQIDNQDDDGDYQQYMDETAADVYK
jgi:hypothetical protein